MNIYKIFDQMTSVDQEKYFSFTEAYNIIDVLDMPEDIQRELGLKHPIWDHATLFLSKTGRILCLQPYLSSSECVDGVKHLDNVRVLGKDKSFYYPGHTNMVLIFLDGAFDAEYVEIRKELISQFRGMEYFDMETCQFRGIPFTEEIMEILKSDVLRKFNKRLVFAVINGENIVGVEGIL